MNKVLMQQAEKIKRTRCRQSNTKLDLMKLYGIFCVVYAHVMLHGVSVSDHLIISSVYVIQLFIFCSGYFYKVETDQTTFLPYLKKCARAYLLPYFVWNLIYGIICQLLRLTGVITYGSDLSLYSFFVRPWLDANQYCFNLPSWFLLSLFLVVMVTWCFRHVLSRKKPMTKTMDYLLLLFFFAISIAAVAILGPKKHYGLKVALFRPMVLLPYYQLGLVYKRYWEGKGKRLLNILVLLAVQILLPILNGDSLLTAMVYGYFSGNPLLLVLGALTAVLLIAEICDLIAPFFQRFRAVQYCSRCTMYIMQHHLFVLFLPQFILWVVNHFIAIPHFNSSSFTGSQWYLFCFWVLKLRALYLPAALLLPVLTHYLYETVILHLAGKGSIPKATSE